MPGRKDYLPQPGSACSLNKPLFHLRFGQIATRRVKLCARPSNNLQSLTSNSPITEFTCYASLLQENHTDPPSLQFSMVCLRGFPFTSPSLTVNWRAGKRAMAQADA